MSGVEGNVLNLATLIPAARKVRLAFAVYVSAALVGAIVFSVCLSVALSPDAAWTAATLVAPVFGFAIGGAMLLAKNSIGWPRVFVPVGWRAWKAQALAAKLAQQFAREVRDYRRQVNAAGNAKGPVVANDVWQFADNAIPRIDAELEQLRAEFSVFQSSWQRELPSDSNDVQEVDLFHSVIVARSLLIGAAVVVLIEAGSATLLSAALMTVQPIVAIGIGLLTTVLLVAVAYACATALTVFRQDENPSAARRPLVFVAFLFSPIAIGLLSAFFVVRDGHWDVPAQILGWDIAALVLVLPVIASALLTLRMFYIRPIQIQNIYRILLKLRGDVAELQAATARNRSRDLKDVAGHGGRDRVGS